jgi:hypothetical protein
VWLASTAEQFRRATVSDHWDAGACVLVGPQVPLGGFRSWFTPGLMRVSGKRYSFVLFIVRTSSDYMRGRVIGA